jgi:hypothetical protein
MGDRRLVRGIRQAPRHIGNLRGWIAIRNGIDSILPKISTAFGGIVDTVEIIQVVAGLLFLLVLAFWVVWISSLSGVLRKCSPGSRTMQPDMVWLLLIPVVNLVFIFVVVNALAASLGNELKLRNLLTNERQPGKRIGIAMAVSGICSFFIPGVILAHLILWIVYWVKIAGIARQLDLASVVLP